MTGRVIPYAKSIGAEWYEGAPADVPASQFLAHNEAWLRARMAEGRQIIDIGEDPASFRPSPNYDMELNTLGDSGYPGYIRTWVPEPERFLMATAH